MPGTDDRIRLLAVLAGVRPLEAQESIPWKWAHSREIAPSVYFHLRDLAPEEERAFFEKAYSLGQMQDLLLSTACGEISSSLNDAGIDYCPMKGCYLAAHVYPDGGLRRRGDIDFLFRNNDDARRAWDLLHEKHGWQIPEFSFDIKQHLTPLFKGRIEFEAHCMLPGFYETDVIREFWESDFRHDAGHEYNMSNELHFAVTLKHAAIHSWEKPYRFLMDFAQLWRQPGFDSEKCLGYCRKLGIAKPETLVMAFPELFGGEESPKGEALQFRNVVTRVKKSMAFGEAAMGEADKFSLAWWWRHCRFYRGLGLRDMDEKCSRTEILKRQICRYARKIMAFFRWFHVSPSDEARRLEDDNAAIDSARELLGISQADIEAAWGREKNDET